MRILSGGGWLFRLLFIWWGRGVENFKLAYHAQSLMEGLIYTLAVETHKPNLPKSMIINC